MTEYLSISPRTVSVSPNSLEFGLDPEICEEEAVTWIYNFSNRYAQLRRTIENMNLVLEDHEVRESFNEVMMRKDLDKLAEKLEILKERSRELLINQKRKTNKERVIWNEVRSLCIKLEEIEKNIVYLSLQLFGKNSCINEKRKGFKINQSVRFRNMLQEPGTSSEVCMEYSMSRRVCDKQKSLMEDYERKINELKENYRKWEKQKKAQNFEDENDQFQESNNTNYKMEESCQEDVVKFLSMNKEGFLGKSENSIKFLKMESDFQKDIITNISTIIGITF
ncbi:uncharacterized protein cubi_03647 [Cryptosporidium ubiquitum]|uniref:Uncharacterized protein n=1 Tax=Cryptosporidium ubiquitum TaxID=857276 RepID=A0A1J4MEZ5_9CRYT|nr:uncharacterized protein cubi_03647 [Cryptosporidium ubiquitum]OII72777.1 hypothetical protein cubi_03647 [Cryptosporidium ubiquitum]